MTEQEAVVAARAILANLINYPSLNGRRSQNHLNADIAFLAGELIRTESQGIEVARKIALGVLDAAAGAK